MYTQRFCLKYRLRRWRPVLSSTAAVLKYTTVLYLLLASTLHSSAASVAPRAMIPGGFCRFRIPGASADVDASMPVVPTSGVLYTEPGASFAS